MATRSKEEGAHIDEWLKEVAPSTELRKWFDHDPDKWKEFQKRDHVELKRSAALKELVAATHKHKVTTLLFAAKDPEYNQAVLQKLIN